MTHKYCYSLDNERFTDGYDDFQRTVSEALSDVNDETHVYVGETVSHENSRFYPDSDVIIEHMACQADDVGGEYAESYPDASKANEEKLNKMLEEMLDKWCKECGVSPSFYSVKNIRTILVETELEVTE